MSGSSAGEEGTRAGTVGTRTWRARQGRPAARSQGPEAGTARTRRAYIGDPPRAAKNPRGRPEDPAHTELVLSELITNAIRYATGPIDVRLLLDRTLICEVADASSTSPHLRYAATTDEGGRGLFLVAQMAERWGTRYTKDGKIIWVEQRLPRPARP